MIGVGTIQDRDVWLVMPMTYMNLSGIALRQMISQKEIPLENILVICDDFNIEFGHLRLRANGGAGGHNGLTSIIEQLHTKNFARLRLGIGSSSTAGKVDFVLGEFNRKEKKGLAAFIQQATDCCTVWLTEGVNKAMTQFNQRKEDE